MGSVPSQEEERGELCKRTHWAVAKWAPTVSQKEGSRRNRNLPAHGAWASQTLELLFELYNSSLYYFVIVAQVAYDITQKHFMETPQTYFFLFYGIWDLFIYLFI